MAKVKTDNPTTEETQAQGTAQEQPQPSVKPTSQAMPSSNPPAGTPEVPDLKEAEIPPVAKKTLQVYPQYAALYIDNHGGAYTTDTKECVRGNATLYSNPYNN